MLPTWLYHSTRTFNFAFELKRLLTLSLALGCFRWCFWTVVMQRRAVGESPESRDWAMPILSWCGLPAVPTSFMALSAKRHRSPSCDRSWEQTTACPSSELFFNLPFRSSLWNCKRFFPQPAYMSASLGQGTRQVVWTWAVVRTCWTIWPRHMKIWGNHMNDWTTSRRVWDPARGSCIQWSPVFDPIQVEQRWPVLQLTTDYVQAQAIRIDRLRAAVIW